MRKYVYLGSTTSYNKFFRRNSFKEQYQVLYSSAPEESLKGIKLFIYKVHNSERINKIVDLPFRRVWAKYIIDSNTRPLLEPNDDICFIFSDVGYRYNSNRVLSYLKRSYPNSKTAFYFNDIVSYYSKRIPNFNIIDFRSLYDYVFTYNETDAVEYNIPIPPPRIRDYSNIEVSDKYNQCDLFFVGKNRGRLKKLQWIYDCCSNAGLKCDFFVTEVDPADISSKYPFHYNVSIPYEEALQRVRKATAVLNLVQEDAKGITLRDYEAIGMNKLLVTDGKAICDTRLYTPEKIVFVDNLQNDLLKFTTSADYSWRGTEYYSEDSLYKWYTNYIDTNRKEE